MMIAVTKIRMDAIKLMNVNEFAICARFFYRSVSSVSGVFSFLVQLSPTHVTSASHEPYIIKVSANRKGSFLRSLMFSFSLN